jgi:peptidoglycan/xylan/chitin deacetylase (PgdA/CDA1 family)
MRMAVAMSAVSLVVLLALGGCPPKPDPLPTPTVLPVDQDVPVDGSVQLIGVMIDAEEQDTAGLQRLTEAMLSRGLPATVYVSADYANANATLIQGLFNKGFEIALHGYSTGEQLATMTYDQQKDLLTRALDAVDGCRPCGLARRVVGFRPQYFSQNEDTYQVLDELGLTYDSGFKAGMLPIAGHEDARIPFPVDGHQFTAIPVTTVEFEGRVIYLCDISCALGESPLTKDQFKEALTQARHETRGQRLPMVANFHGWYTGDTDQYDYFEAFTQFIDEAVADHAVFVRSEHLAELFAAHP